jgi:butyryl-CoA dehydrogenase
LLFNYLAKNLREFESFSSMAKFSATQLSFEVCRICMETLGELGLDKSKKGREIFERCKTDTNL